MSAPVQGCLGLWESTGSNCFALTGLNPLQLLETHLSSAAPEGLRGPQQHPGLSPRISSLSLACCRARGRCSVCPRPASRPTHRLITSTIISSSRGMNSSDEEDEGRVGGSGEVAERRKGGSDRGRVRR